MYSAPQVEQMDLVTDNLNTHTTDTLIEIYGKPEADRILSRVVFHYTPLHTSWTNIAEIEFSAMTSQCLARRIPDEWILATELVAWELRRNQLAQPIHWSFTWKQAKRLFIESERMAVISSIPQNYMRLGHNTSGRLHERLEADLETQVLLEPVQQRQLVHENRSQG